MGVARSGRTIILGYHRVATVDRDPHALCVAPSRFAEHLEVVQRNAEIVPLRAVRERSTATRAVITFDDGYVDNASVVAPILDELGVPATFFIASGMIGSPHEYWWDKLESRLMAHPLPNHQHEVEKMRRPNRIDVRSEEARPRAVSAHGWRGVGLPLPTNPQIHKRLAEGDGGIKVLVAPA